MPVCLWIGGCLIGLVLVGATDVPLPRTEQLHTQNESHEPALKRLRCEADKALKAGPFSVVFQGIEPPSGDLHDFASLAPYWWPNPATENGLPYIRRDGKINEENIKNSDGQALARLADSVWTLALAYHLTGEEVYARHAAKLLRVWFLDTATRMNPHLRYGQGIPGITPGRSLGIITTRDLIPVVEAVGFLKSSPAWTVHDQRGMETWCKTYLDWLLTSEFGRTERSEKNNHGTWFDAQVVALALFVGQNGLAREVLETSKRRRIDEAIEPDGRQLRELVRTKSFGYSVFHLEGLFTLARLGNNVGVDLWHYISSDGRSIRAALDYVAPYADPERKWPHPELYPEAARQRLMPLLLQAYAVYGEERYQQLLKHFPADEVLANRVHLLYSK